MTQHRSGDAGVDRRPGVVVRILAVMVAGTAIWLLVGWLTTEVYAGWSPTVRHVANAAVTFVLAVPMVVAARRFLDRRPWAGLQLGGVGGGWWPLVAGALASLVPALAGIVLSVALGWVELTVQGSVGEVLGAVLLLIVLVFVYEAFPEELFFRGYIHRNLVATLPPWLAVAGQALLFTLFGTTLWVVTDGWAVLGERLLLFFAMGVVLGCIRVLAGNVWACIGYHLAFQVVAQLLLAGRYAGIEVRGEGRLTLVAFGAAFALGPYLVAMLLPSRENWRDPEPDLVSTEAADPV